VNKLRAAPLLRLYNFENRCGGRGGSASHNNFQCDAHLFSQVTNQRCLNLDTCCAKQWHLNFLSLRPLMMIPLQYGAEYNYRPESQITASVDPVAYAAFVPSHSPAGP